MRSTVKIVSAIIVIIFAGIALHAQTTINNFTLSVWPEYDHPGVLVVFNGQVDSTALPLEVTYPIPEASMYALVAGSTDTTENQMIPIPIQDGPQGKEIRFTAVHPVFHVEFYFNPFQANNAHRHYSYDFTSNLPIDSLVILLQEPLTSQQFAAEIPIDQRLQDNHGIIYHQKQYAGIAAGDTVHVEAHYENPEGTMTTDVLQSQMAGSGQQGTGIASTTSGGGGVSSLWIVLIAVGLVAGVFYFVTQSKPKQESAAEEAPEPEQAKPAAAGKQSKESDTRFCIHCGESIPRAAKFCTKCGKSQTS